MRRVEFHVTAPNLGALAVFAGAFVIAYRFGLSFTQEIAAPFWFPDSVLLCALLLSPPSAWWAYIALTVPVRLMLIVSPDTPYWFLVACLINDSAKGLLSAWLLRKVSRTPAWLESLRGFTLYVLIAVLLAPGLSAFAAAPTRVYLGDHLWTAFRDWFFGNALASLMLTPLLVCLVTAERQWYRRLSVKEWIGAIVIVAGLILGSFVAFHGAHEHPAFFWYLPVPFLLWAAVSFGPLGVSAGLSLITLVAIFATISSGVHLDAQSASAVLFSMQLFLFCVAVPFMFLSVLSKQQRKTAASLRESEKRFRSLVDTAPVMVWICDADGQCTFVNKPWSDFTGRSLQQQLGSGWTETVHPDDRRKCSDLCRVGFETKEGFVAEYRIRRNDGVYRWILDHGVPRFDSDGKFLGFIGTCIDITDRRETEEKLRQLSSQLIHAQESERFRIGQELHEDLSQRAAALAMGLSHLSRKYIQNETLTVAFDRMRQHAMELCIDIARLSHQLHPTTLEKLGLPVALRSLCEQLNGDGRKVIFVCDNNLPELSSVVSVSLYRIAQESLRNALTHSGATFISVELTLSNESVNLSVKDTGRGFVVDSARLGLGLSGMAARMRTGGGSFNVLSTPGAGTTIRATVPILKSMKAVKRHGLRDAFLCRGDHFFSPSIKHAERSRQAGKQIDQQHSKSAQRCSGYAVCDGLARLTNHLFGLSACFGALGVLAQGFRRNAAPFKLGA
jgi:PAS domain S-box-containing protein